MNSAIPLEMIIGTEGSERLTKAKEAIGTLDRLSQQLTGEETLWNLPGQSPEETLMSEAIFALNEFFASMMFLAFQTGYARVVVDLLPEMPAVTPKVSEWITESILYFPENAQEQLTDMMQQLARALIIPQT